MEKTNRKKIIVEKLRSLTFDVLFYTLTGIYITLLFIPSMLLPQKFIAAVFRIWARCVMKGLKFIVGLDYQVKGLENKPSDQPCLIACKHQSAWETIIFACLFYNHAIVFKKELLFVPLFGLYLKKLGMICVDREGGREAVNKMVFEAKKLMSDQRPLVIFPEGTRSIPGQKGDYKAGIIFLYFNLNVPVVPVSLNSGLFWGRRSTYKKPGTITIEFLPHIQPGLPKKEFLLTLSNELDQSSIALAQVKNGI